MRHLLTLLVTCCAVGAQTNGLALGQQLYTGMQLTSVPWAAGASSTLTTGLLAFWKMDDASSNRTDSASTNTLLDVGSVGTNSGKIGIAAATSGANYLKVGRSLIQQTGTVAGWFFWNAAFNTVANAAWGTQIGSASGAYAHFSMFDKYYASGNKLYCGFYSNATETRIAATMSAANAPQSNWVHYALKWQLGAGTWLYTNGVLYGSNAGCNSMVITNANTSFIVGGLCNQGVCGGEAAGRVDDLGVWSRMLSATEIVTLYSNGTQGVTYPWTGSP